MREWKRIRGTSVVNNKMKKRKTEREKKNEFVI